ncbi:hypothetical protein GH733_009856 [Mirounga leonina]|nr:hypothetical protein GH733_009856 [Mirounga leonina]
MCLPSGISVLRKEGVFWQKCHFACCVQDSPLTRYCELCSHQLVIKPVPSLGAQISRVPGSGTQSSGQGAFGNMCRGGCVFAPTKARHHWHRIVNTTQQRYAMCSALAASALPALVMSKGHQTEEIPELVLVKTESYKETKEAVLLLKKLKAWNDSKKVYASEQMGDGKSQMRPCVLYSEDNGIMKAFRNILGITLLNVSKLSTLKLVPGEHVGRFCIWTESASRSLDDLRGTWRKAASLKIPKCPPSTTQEDSLPNPEVESTEKPENHVEAKPIGQDHKPE